jgi:hypothetical protein
MQLVNYKLAFKPCKTVLTDGPRVFGIGELIFIFAINISQISEF